MRVAGQVNRFVQLQPQRYTRLTDAFVKWGGFASTSSQDTTGPSTRPTLDDLVKRGSRFLKTEPPAASVGGETPSPPPPPEEPHKPFNHEFDEPARSTETQTSTSSRAAKGPSAQPQSLLTMQREGKRLTKKQKALLQAAAISRTPLPNPKEKVLTEAKKEEEHETEAASEPRMETDEEKKQFQSRVWNLVRGKWF
jgi:hypothetical protein